MQERKYWIVLYHHGHGTDAWCVFDKEPTEEEIIASMKEEGTDFEPDKGEFIEWVGPKVVPPPIK